MSQVIFVIKEVIMNSSLNLISTFVSYSRHKRGSSGFQFISFNCLLQQFFFHKRVEMNFLFVHLLLFVILAFEFEVHGGDVKFTSIDVCVCNDTSAVEIAKCDHSDHEMFFSIKVKKIIRKLLVNIYHMN